MWLPWYVAAFMAALLGLLGAAAQSRLPGRSALAGAVASETAIVLSLYAVWMKLADFAVTGSAAAAPHAMSVWHLEQRVHFPSEVTVQRAILAHPLVVQAFNGFYAIAHVPALIVFLIWMFARHRDVYPRWRNVGAVLTLSCLFIQTIPVAPPRLMPALGFVDTALRYGQSVYGTGGLKIAPQVAAMPSVHVGWAVLIAAGVVCVSRSRWRWLIVAHPVVTMLAVVVTANHWWLDGVVAAALLPAALVVVVGPERAAAALKGRPLVVAVPALSTVGESVISDAASPERGDRERSASHASAWSGQPRPGDGLLG
jgi:hypothetical protein